MRQKEMAHNHVGDGGASERGYLLAVGPNGGRRLSSFHSTSIATTRIALCITRINKLIKHAHAWGTDAKNAKRKKNNIRIKQKIPEKTEGETKHNQELHILD